MSDVEASAYATSEEEHALQKLHYWLRYEGQTAWLGGGAFFLPYSLISAVLTTLAVVFTPYMLWRLAKAKWYKAIALFIILVCVPFLATRFMQGGSSTAYYLWTTVSLVLFYVYTWVLRSVIGDHLREQSATRHIMREERSRHA